MRFMLNVQIREVEQNNIEENIKTRWKIVQLLLLLRPLLLQGKANIASKSISNLVSRH